MEQHGFIESVSFLSFRPSLALFLPFYSPPLSSSEFSERSAVPSVDAAAARMRLAPLFGLLALSTGFRVGLQPRGHAPRQPPVVASYQELKSIDTKVDDLQSNVNEMLLGFYDRRRSCFALTPGRPRFSITSTCCSLLAVDASRLRWRDQARLCTPSARPSHTLRTLRTLHTSPCGSSTCRRW